MQGYAKTYFATLFYSDSGAPYDLTGVLQIVVSHPGAQPPTPVNEFYAAQAVLTTTGDTTSASPVLANVPSVAGLAQGQVIVGAGITVGTTVVSFDATAHTVTMSAPATATATGVSLTFNTATNVTLIGSPGSGRIQVTVPAYDSAQIIVNPAPPQLQDLQVSVTNADGSVTAFILGNVLNVVLPPFGVV